MNGLVPTFLFSSFWEGGKLVSLPLMKKGEEITFEGYEGLGEISGVQVVSQTLHLLTPKGYYQKVALRPFKGSRSPHAPLEG